MTPSERAWLEARIAEWSELAASNRRIAATREGPINRARGLESVVRRLQARLDAVKHEGSVCEIAQVAVSADPYQAASIKRMQDCLDRWRDMEGPLTNGTRAIMIGKLADLGISQEPPKPTLFERMSEIAAAARSIPAIPKPFTMGPQMDMFA